MLQENVAVPPWARIVVVAFRSGDHIADCIAALARQTFSDFEVVIVDNDCPDDCTNGLRLPDERFRIIEAATNLGFAGGANLGAAASETVWIVTLNPDATPEPGWLAALRQAAAAYPEAAALGSTLIQANAGDRIDSFGDVYSLFGMAWQGGHDQAVGTLPCSDVLITSPCAAAAAYRRDVFDQLKGFDEAFFCYLEDVDLGLRINGSGHACTQVLAARASHVGSATLGKGSDFQFYHTWRNQLRLLVKNAPLAVLPFQLVIYLLASAYILVRNRSAIGARARYEGWRDGVSALPRSLAVRMHTQRSAPIEYLRMVSKRPGDLRTLPTRYWRVAKRSE